MTELEIVDKQAGIEEFLAAHSQGNIEVGILALYQSVADIGTNLIMSCPSQADLPISP